MSELTKVDRCPGCNSGNREYRAMIYNYPLTRVVCKHPWHSSPVPEGPAQSSETVPTDVRTHPVTAEKSANDGVEYSPSNTVEHCGMCGGEKGKPLLLLENNVGPHGKWHSNMIGCAVKPKCTKCADIFHKRAAQPSPVVQTPDARYERLGKFCAEMDKAGVTLQFGLKAQGHMPTVERMRGEGKSWAEIGDHIGWVGSAVEEFYELETRPPAPVVPVEETKRDAGEAILSWRHGQHDFTITTTSAYLCEKLDEIASEAFAKFAALPATEKEN